MAPLQICHCVAIVFLLCFAEPVNFLSYFSDFFPSLSAGVNFLACLDSRFRVELPDVTSFWFCYFLFFHRCVLEIFPNHTEHRLVNPSVCGKCLRSIDAHRLSSEVG